MGAFMSNMLEFWITWSVMLEARYNHRSVVPGVGLYFWNGAAGYGNRSPARILLRWLIGYLPDKTVHMIGI